MDELELRLRERFAATEAKEPWVTIKRAAEHAACSPESIRRAIASGLLDSGKVHGDHRVKLSVVDRWIVEGARVEQSKRSPSKGAALAEKLGYGG